MTPRRLSKSIFAVALVATPVVLLVLRYRLHEAALAERATQNAARDVGVVEASPTAAASSADARAMDDAGDR